MGLLRDIGHSGGLRRLSQQYEQGQTGLMNTAMQAQSLKMRRDEHAVQMRKEQEEIDRRAKPIDIRYTGPVLDITEMHGGDPNNPKVQEFIKKTQRMVGATGYMTTVGELEDSKETFIKDAEYMETRNGMKEWKLLGRITVLNKKTTLNEKEQDELDGLKAEASMTSATYQKWQAGMNAGVKNVLTDTAGRTVHEMKDGSIIYPDDKTTVPQGEMLGLNKLGARETPDSMWLAAFTQDNPDAGPKEVQAAVEQYNLSKVWDRYPPWGQLSGMPPGYLVNRRTGGTKWVGDGPAPELTPASAALWNADKGSITKQTLIKDIMASFIRNMDSQIERVTFIAEDLSRSNMRLANVPWRQLQMKVKGSPIESKVGMYVRELSSEIGKLASGSQASVRELSIEAQKKWDEIHDINLSIPDLISLLKETQNSGHIRYKGAHDQLNSTIKRTGGNPLESEFPDPAIGGGIDEWLRDARKANPGVSEQELRTYWNKTYGDQ